MFRIEMLPAAEGDALWIEYGHPNAPLRVLVDGGPARTYHALRSRILQLPPGSRRFEAVVVTHIDADHIDGIILLLLDETLGVEIGDIWFNGYPQLIEADTQGPAEGEILGALIQERGFPWNAAFGHRAVVGDDDFTPHELADGLTATVLGPTWTELESLLTHWDAVLAEEEWVAGDQDQARAELAERTRFRGVPPLEAAPLPDELGGVDDFESDSSIANASSIVLLVEDGEGRKCLLTGDAHAPILVPRLQALGRDEPIEVAGFKLPHHGSKKNVSLELLGAVDPMAYLVSSSGAKYSHPDQVTIERILTRHQGERRKPRIHFNYRSAFNEMWADPELQEARRYVASYPEGLAADL